MNSLQNIIDQHYTLLKERGYCEESLRGFPYPKPFPERLSENFAIAVLKGLAQGKPSSFTVPLNGYFRGDRDTVHLDIGFRYTPSNGDFSMESVTGWLKGLKLEIPLRNPERDLPPADQLYFQLNHTNSRPAYTASHPDDMAREIVLLAAMVNRDKLETAGIVNPITRETKHDWFIAKFEEKAIPLLTLPRSEAKPSFVIPFSKRFAGDAFRTDFRLLFQVNLVEPVIADLKAIHAHATGAKRFYLINEPGVIPSGTKIQSDLSTDGMKKIAALMHATITDTRHHRHH